MTLAVPLSPRQVKAACRLHGRLTQWHLSDTALARLHAKVPGFDGEACLLKSVAINTLYGTQVFAIVAMARHIERIFVNGNALDAGPELVEEIAALPIGGTRVSRKFTSFAAKFCHFFVDKERFPIYDDAARSVIRFHLGAAQVTNDNAHPYLAFCKNLARLRAIAGIKAPGRDLDRYLWITGLYMKWLRERGEAKSTVNAELQRVLRNPTREEAVDLNALLPEKLKPTFQ